VRPRRLLEICAVDFTAFHMLRPLMVGAARRGWQVEFACSDGAWAERLRVEGFPHRQVAIPRAFKPLSLLQAAWRLGRSLRRDPPDLIHTHTPAGGVVGRLAALAVPDIPVVHTLHGLPFATDDIAGPTARTYLVIERALARRTRLFFSQARGDAGRASRLGIARAADTVVIGNGVDLTRFRPDASRRQAARAEFGISDDEIVVLAVARLVREKGVLDLAEAATLVSGRVRFLIAGGALPSDRSSVVNEVSAHRVNDIPRRWQLLGHREDIERLLNSADLFVLPSYREGLPRSVIEALASGVPVVASDIPACRELVDMTTGVLIPPGDVAALARAIEELAADEGVRHRLGANARRVALERADEDRIVSTQLDLFETLVRIR
jgi:glycosyltransferase involved in cell wall biosynthesis